LGSGHYLSVCVPGAGCGCLWQLLLQSLCVPGMERGKAAPCVCAGAPPSPEAVSALVLACKQQASKPLSPQNTIENMETISAIFTSQTICAQFGKVSLINHPHKLAHRLLTCSPTGWETTNSRLAWILTGYRTTLAILTLHIGDLKFSLKKFSLH